MSPTDTGLRTACEGFTRSPEQAELLYRYVQGHIKQAQLQLIVDILAEARIKQKTWRDHDEPEPGEAHRCRPRLSLEMLIATIVTRKAMELAAP